VQAANFRLMNNTPYAKITIDKNDVVKATNFTGIRFVIGYLKGEIIDKEIVK